MARFIKVTLVDNTIIRVNVDQINMYYRNTEEREIKHIEVRGGENLMHMQEGTILEIKESPEYIDLLMDDSVRASIGGEESRRAAWLAAKEYNGKPL